MSDIDPNRAALEALIFAADEPTTPHRLRKALPRLTPARIAELVEEINADLAASGRPYEIAAVGGGYQFRTRSDYSRVLQAAEPDRKVRLSKAALETLAVIAYRQPITRAEIDDVRSVDCGAVVRSLLERDLVRIVGRRDAPGRPALYGTSSTFLETFGLASLRDMPALQEVQLPEAAAGTPQTEAAADAEEASAPEPDESEVADDPALAEPVA